MSICLAIDSSGRGGQVVLAQAGGASGAQLLASAHHDLAQGNAETLFSLFDEALSAAGREKAQIGRVAVLRGPGSFTGLRIGIMTAKGLAYGLGCELWSAACLQLLAHESDSPCLALVAAGRGHAFVQPFAGARGTARRELAEPLRLDAEGIAKLGEKHRCERIQFSAADAAAAELCGAEQLSAFATVEIDAARRLAELTVLGLFPAEQSDPAALMPVYLAPSQAERTHGIDLGAEVHTPVPPESWG